MKLILTDHIKIRLRQREIPRKVVKEIISQNLENYWDNLRNHHIVIGKLNYHGVDRKILVAYDTIDKEIEAVTIHPVTDNQIKQRLNSGRWSYEKDTK